MEFYAETAIEIINELHTERLDYTSEYLPLINAAQRLAAYLDTGLEPEEIVKNGMMLEDSRRYSGRLELKLKAYEELGSIDRLRELAQADKEGRCVVFQPGYDIVFVYNPADEDGLYTKQVTGVISQEEYESVMEEKRNG